VQSVATNPTPRPNGRIAVDAAIARAAGRDAGNRSMRAAGRSAWNEDDWSAACDMFDRLMRLAGEAPPVLRPVRARRAVAAPRRKAA
jgi:hypothetical protein